MSFLDAGLFGSFFVKQCRELKKRGPNRVFDLIGLVRFFNIANLDKKDPHFGQDCSVVFDSFLFVELERGFFLHSFRFPSNSNVGVRFACLDSSPPKTRVSAPYAELSSRESIKK